tara:strand:- start:623 stop:880 length:258 start_codon:yes stop_codon:yes gene_type:complete
MRKKIEIKVYLPYEMVATLESRRKANNRSKFIEEAIQEKLDRKDEFDKSMLTDREVYRLMYTRIIDKDDVLTGVVKQYLLEVLNQ